MSDAGRPNDLRRTNDLRRAKGHLRREMLARRDAAPVTRREAAAPRIHERVLGFLLDEARDARTVAGFSSFGSEVQTGPLLSQLVERGYRVTLPRIEEGEILMRTWSPGDPMTRTSFGALEPAAGEPLSAGQLDVVLTPGVAFDRRGYRIGYGGGFYDRLFDGLRADASRVGVCFAFQVVDRVPAGPIDEPVDLVLTEDESIVAAR